MSNKHIETLQYYKDYADSTQVLNEALNREVKDCYQQIDSLRSEVRRLQTSRPIESPPVWMSFDQQRVPQLQSQLRRCNQQLNDAQLQIITLQAQLQGEQHSSQMKQAALIQKDDQLMQLRSSIRELQSKLYESQRKYESAQLEVDRHGTLASHYQEALAKSAQSYSLDQQRELNELKYTIDTQYKQLNQCHDGNTTLTLTIERLQEELNRMQENSEWLQTRVSEQGSGHETLLKQIEGLTEERQEIQAKLRELNSQCEELRVRNGQLVEELNQKAAKSTQIEELSSKIEQMSMMIAQEKRTYEQKNSMMGMDHSHMFSMVSETSFPSQQRLKEQNAQLNRDLQTKNALLMQFEQRVDRLNAQLDQLQSSRSQSQITAVELRATQEELRRLQNKLDRTENQLKESSEMKIELVKLRGDTREMHDLKLENTKLQTTIKILNVQNQELRSKINKLQQEVLTLSEQTLKPQLSQGELMSLQTQYADTLLQNTILLEQNSRLQIKRTELLNDLEDVRMELAYHADSYDQMKDLKHRLKDAYLQMDHLNRMIAHRDGQDVNKAKRYKMRSPQHERILSRNPERQDSRGKIRHRSPFNRMYRQHREHKEAVSGNNWQFIQKKIQSLQSQNQELRRNLMLNPSKRI